MSATRTERDSMGTVAVPADALYGAQTQRAVQNFPVSGLPMPPAFVQGLALVKQAAARANADLGLLDGPRAEAIAAAARAVSAGEHADQFPVDVFQTGSGTSTNMNLNEVLATLAQRALGEPVSPNDHVNMGQSSNDVIPTALHVSAAILLAERLLPALAHLQETLQRRAVELDGVVKTGRTHLMDAMPVRLGQELAGWAAQVGEAQERLEDVMPRLLRIAQGGTAVGTGVNAHPELAGRVAGALAAATGLEFAPAPSCFARMGAQDTAVELSGQLKALAVGLTKIANDLRWMNSGPLAGLGEITLEPLQPGSSIMPGKVNPVIPEAVAQVAAQVMGNDLTITVAGQSGSFELNVMLPVIAHNLLQSEEILANAARLLADRAIATFTVNAAALESPLARSPVLVTALAPRLGYLAAAEIAKAAAAEGRTVLEVALERTELPREELEAILDPRRLTGGGLPGSP